MNGRGSSAKERRSVDQLGVSPFSSSQDLRRRYWAYTAILAVPMLVLVVTEVIGAGTWISATVLLVFVGGICAIEFRRGRAARQLQGRPK